MRTRPTCKTRCSSMPRAICLKTVTNDVGWSVVSKTTTFGLKFVTVPLLALVTSDGMGAAAPAG
jgi:succinoglycan exporter